MTRRHGKSARAAPLRSALLDRPGNQRLHVYDAVGVDPSRGGKFAAPDFGTAATVAEAEVGELRRLTLVGELVLLEPAGGGAA